MRFLCYYNTRPLNKTLQDGFTWWLRCGCYGIGTILLLFEQEHESSLVDVTYSVILDSKDCIIEIKDKFLGKKRRDRNLPVLRSLANRPDIEQISETVDSVIRSNNKLAR
jgi:hypothetical protein